MTMTQDTAVVPDTQPSGFLGGFAPAPITDDSSPAPWDSPVAAAPEVDPAVKITAKPAEPTAEQTKLSDLIRADRERREQAMQVTAQAASIKSENEQLKAEIATLKSAPRAARFEDDPVGYIKANKISKDVQVLLGQSLLYDLAPEKTPVELRQRMFEQKLAREKAEEAETRTAAQQKADREADLAYAQRYHNQIVETIKTLEPGSFPESEVWFDDHNVYAQSLLATANNLAKHAKANGRVADLSPRAVAAALEAEVARKMAARDARRKTPVTTKEQTPAQAGSGKLPAVTSTKDLNTGGRASPAVTDAERVARATAVAFRTR